MYHGARLLSARLNEFLIKQKIQNTDIQDALLIIPALANIMPHNDFREGIPRQTKGFVFSDRFLFSFQRISGLDVGFSSSARCDKVNFPGNLNGLTVTVEDDGGNIVALDVERSSREIEG